MLPSIVLPLLTALAASVENRRWLITRPNLDLHEVGSLAAAAPRIGALDSGRVGVLEGVSSAEHVVDFLPLEVHLVFVLGLDPVNVRARLAEEAEVV